ncbi:MAG: Cof-type HAD-IIB family hydrolase [Elainella sp. Prado103]|jgi:hypothetical protein|nr:Cof-type HAD-IIB family hydrolase [Elainella sp. Prado103]
MQILSANVLRSVRLIATDMDGTLTRHEKYTPKLLQTLTDLAVANIPVLIVTGRSAGWVNAIEHYLPIAGAIAENGGIFYRKGMAERLIELPELQLHRQRLAQMFATLQQQFPQIRTSEDNAFRITDWTFDVQGISLLELRQMECQCQAQGWGFTYSTVQCHIRPLGQDKAIGLKTVLSRFFADYDFREVVTVGDSPNDQSLFDPALFPISVGVANLAHYTDQLQSLPAYLTQAAEVEGFCELANILLTQRAA